MKNYYFACLFVVSIAYRALADVYMHNPRGSNNRLNEKSANRRTGNRLFDSQNNNRGGYNVGDRTNRASNSEATQYQMTFFMSSPKYKTYSDDRGKTLLHIEWTNQHGCGGDEDKDPHKLNCNVVLQYMCQLDDKYPSNSKDRLRDGTTTNRQDYQRGSGNDVQREKESQNTANGRKNRNVRTDRGYQESWEWYDKCRNRQRNKGLFTADQKLGCQEATCTRQNPNGQNNRNGYECPEERDYYPYWHPTPWKDIAVLADNISQCDSYKTESFNVKPKFECIQKFPDGKVRHWSQHNNEADCKADQGEWVEFTNYLEEAPGSIKSKTECENNKGNANGIKYIWGRPYGSDTKKCLIALDAPECYEAPWTRVNHLGNGKDGKPVSHKWVIPYFPSMKKQRCVLRIRYNITTDDYDPFNTDSSSNQDKAKGVYSPVQNNPTVDIGAGNTPLKLAINTAQYGRTFQDRSHVFLIEKRPAGIDDQIIHNINVRGKRGNIVQVYPAVEYDFVPNHLEIKAKDLVHFQWTGSNTHNNQAPGGDGQTGDAGEGTGGTDRSNVCEIKDRNDNFCLPLENAKMFIGATCMDPAMPSKKYSGDDIAVTHVSAGYYSCVKTSTCGAGKSLEGRNPPMDNLLNNAPASFKGMLCRLQKGEYVYMCTRNNNFTNRSQKGSISVK